MFTVLFFRNYQKLFVYKYLLALAAVVLIASTTFFGYEVNGAKLWLALGPVSFQPSEFARIALVVFCASFIFVYRGMKIALLAEDDGSKLLAFGLTAMFAVQALIIVGGVTKAIPLTGITLPFVSYGSSSVVGNFIITGLLLAISEDTGKQLVEEYKEAGYATEKVTA